MMLVDMGGLFKMHEVCKLISLYCFDMIEVPEEAITQKQLFTLHSENQRLK